jgi:hypothetical protein
MTTLPDFAAVVTAYAQFWQTAEAHCRPCPACGRRRVRHGKRARWVHWAPGQRDRQALIRLRCRPYQTVETCFPPWLVPYEELTLDQLTTLLTAARGAGPSWRRVACAVGCDPLTVRRRWRRWGPWEPWLRQQGAQHAAAWGIALAWAT